jgi:rhodanese-related sulfurtransferase
MNNDYFNGQGYRNGNLICLSPKQAYEFLMRNAVLVDLRDDYETEFRQFDVPNVVYITVKNFKDEYAALPKNKPLILADNAGTFSKELVLFQMENGYTNAASLIGGVLEWLNDQMPMVINRDYELNGQCSCKLKTRKFRSHTDNNK